MFASTAKDLGLGRLLRDRGQVRQLGGLILSFDTTTSTNDVAGVLARKGLPHGSLVWADAQTAGRGRWGRHWVSSAGAGVYLTAVLRPGDAALAAYLPGFIGALAAAEALRDLSGERVVVRWPNDLYLQGRKLAGVLCEASFRGTALEYVVMGFGVNLNQDGVEMPAELDGSAISLRSATGRVFDRVMAGARIVERLEHWWEMACDGDGRAILTGWSALAEGQNGMKVSIRLQDREFDAVTAGLAEDGGLRVDLGGGSIETLYSADVVWLRPR